MTFEPRRLESARWWCGLRKGELAARTGLSAKSISSYERGDTEPSHEQVALLAHALGVHQDFFFRSPVAIGTLESVGFRAHSTLDARTRDRALARVMLAGDITRRARDLFNIPTWNAFDRDLAVLKPEMAARALRAEWGLSDKKLPNIVRLLEAKGVNIFSMYEEPHSLSASSCWVEARPTMFLTLTKTGQRQRFDACHELGHLVLHADGTKAKGRDAEEEADDFASAFLMPMEAVIAYAPRNPGLDEVNALRHRFGVSIPAVIVRLRKLGLITEWRYKSLMIQASEQGLRTQDPEAIPFETSGVWRAVFSALRESGDLDDFCYSIGMSYEHIADLVFRPLPIAMPDVGEDSRRRLRLT